VASNGKLHLEEKAIEELVPAEWNPRSISSEALDGLEKSIDRFGLVQPIIWNKRTQRVVGGHQRLRVLQRKGAVTAEVVVVDFSEDEEKALCVALNNEKLQGDWTSTLKDLLGSISNQSLLDGLRTDGLLAALDPKKDDDTDSHLEDVQVVKPPKMVWALIAVPVEKYQEVASKIEEIAKLPGVTFDSVIRG